MLTVEQVEAIRRAYYCDHKSVRAIAREQHHGRRVVREAIAGTRAAPRRYQLRRRKPRPVLDPVVALIDAWLAADQRAPRKQRHTAQRIYDRLVAEHGFTGGVTVVRDYVQAWKRMHQEPAGFLPLAHAPGAEAQCDWGEAVVRIGGVEQVAYLFCFRLSHSLKPFVCAFPTTRQECFLAGHVAAFAALGGVPDRVVYDNLSAAVLKVLRGRSRVEQETFIAFRGHYLYASHFCLPGREGAHEKPLVETLVGYARRNFLVPVPDMPSWEALNALLAARCAAEDARVVPGHQQPIGALWQVEQARLRPVPPHPFPCCRTIAVRATRQALVTFERNRYSVPTHYAGERLVLRAYAWTVELTDGQAVVAQHPRLYGRDGEQLDPLHYLALLAQKPGAFDYTRPIQRWAKEWPPIYHRYLAALRQARPETATREFVGILQLHARYDAAAIAAALERAYALQCWSADGVEQCLRQARPPGAPVPALDLAGVPGLAPLAAIQIPLPDLAAFNQLLPEVPA
ncbi:MAG TPA: IS21 family transposase [Thermomicrobiales bacterium]|nr:IS21 family transposase [Thermomicrobiales bacterium]